MAEPGNTKEAADNSLIADNPTDEFKHQLWDDYVKPFLDYRSYFQQRSRLLSVTELLPDLSSRDWRHSGWKSPLSFALQGTLIISIALGLLTGFFSNFVKERPTIIFRVERSGNGANIIPVSVPQGSAWSTKQKLLEQNIATLQGELNALDRSGPGQQFLPPIPYAESENPTLFMLSVALRIQPVSREEAEADYHQEISSLQQKLLVARLSPYVEQASEKMEHILPAIAFLLAAYLFRGFVRRKAELHNQRLDKAHIAYLYLVSARLFWVSLGWSFVFNLRSLLARYFPESFSLIVTDLDQTLRSIDGPKRWPIPVGQTIYLLACVILAVWSLALLWKASVQLRVYFGFPAASRCPIFAGERKLFANLLLANLCAGLVTLILFAILANLYGALRLGLEHFAL